MLYRSLICCLMIILSACGGNDGKGGSNESSSSSSISGDPCNNSGGTVFAECLNSHYGQFVGADFAPSYVEYTTSNSNQQIQWSVIESNDPTHNNVLDISFLDNTKRALLYVGTPGDPTLRDMSAYKTGKLTFDIRVLDWGQTFDEEKSGAIINFRTECVWPCAAHYANILVTTLDTWQHVEISLADFVASGLDITKVNNAFQFSTEAFTQQGLHFQLDNIQYVKGPNTGSNSPKIIFKEDFNSQNISNWVATNYIGSAQVYTWPDVGAAILINWSGINDIVRWETTLDKTINITNKTARFQLRCLKYANTGFTLALTAEDSSGNRIISDTIYDMDLDGDNWNQFTFDIGDQFGGSFKPKNVKKIGFEFTTISNVAQTYCYIDTIQIIE